MAEKTTEEDNAPFDKFELISAIVLGLGALGGAWAGYQAGLWGGNQATAYAEAANMMSEASGIFTEASSAGLDASMVGNRDADIDLQTKRLLFEADHSEDPELKKRNIYTAKYLYIDQLSEEAQRHLGLPKQDDFEKLTDAELIAANQKSLDEKYFDEIYKEAESEYDRAEGKQKEARKKFFEGQVANYNGDLLELTAVLYTVCLFLAGIGLVFKTNIKWGFLVMASLGLVGSTVHLARNPWTSVEAPKFEEDSKPVDSSSSASASASAAPK
jgi:hypothetical protein